MIVVIAAAAIVFVARQGTLAGIRTENVELRRQLEAQPMVEPAIVQGAPMTNLVSALTADEQRELLRLRGQVQPLRRELAELSNQVARAEQRKAAPLTGEMAAVPPAMKARVEAMRAEIAAFMQTDRGRNAQKLAVALRDYVKANGNVPSTLAELASQPNSRLPAGITEKFELVESRHGPGDKETLVVRARDSGTNGPRGLLDLLSDGSIRFVALGGLPDYSKR